MKDDTISRQAALKGLENLNIASFYEENEHSKGAYTEVKAMLNALPSAQLAQDLTNGCTDTISRQAALNTIDANNGILYDSPTLVTSLKKMVNELPPTQPGQRNARVFKGIIVEYPSISAYPEYEGKPYFSIKYTENGQEFIGYGTYKPEVLSEYLKEYFMPPTKPGCEDAVSRADADILIEEVQTAWLRGDILLMYPALKKGLQKVPPVTPKQPGWIPCSERLPNPGETVLVTHKSGVSFAWHNGKYWERGASTNHREMRTVVAWMPLPPKWEGDANG